MADLVYHPPHYTGGDVECIDAIKASMTHEGFLDFLKGNVIKYLWRYRMKNNPAEDVRKAKFYLDRMVEEMTAQAVGAHNINIGGSHNINIGGSVSDGDGNATISLL